MEKWTLKDLGHPIPKACLLGCMLQFALKGRACAENVRVSGMGGNRWWQWQLCKIFLLETAGWRICAGVLSLVLYIAGW